MGILRFPFRRTSAAMRSCVLSNRVSRQQPSEGDAVQARAGSAMMITGLLWLFITWKSCSEWLSCPLSHLLKVRLPYLALSCRVATLLVARC
jgi:hypothetical protein